MYVIDLTTGIGPETKAEGDILGTLKSLVGGEIKIRGVVRYLGRICYVVENCEGHRLARNDIATGVFKQICYGVVVLIPKEEMV